MYTTDHIWPVIPIKHLVNQYSEPTTPHKLENETKNSVTNLCVLFFPCVVRKATAHVDKNELNIGHKPQRHFCGTFVRIP